MAARKKSAVKKSAPLVDSAQYALRLLDFRTVSLQCERFCTPEEAPKGRLESDGRAQIDVSLATQKDGKTIQAITVTFFAKTTGIRVEFKDGKEVDGDKSFLVDLRAEGLFSVKGREIGSKEELPEHRVRELLIQCHPLVMARIRESVNAMGFRNARPTLGMEPNYKPVVVDGPAKVVVK